MLSGSARASLNTLLPNSIFGWTDLQEEFLNNFQGTYQCPASQYDPDSIIQQDVKTLHQFISRWLKKKNSNWSIQERLQRRGNWSVQERLQRRVLHARAGPDNHPIKG